MGTECHELADAIPAKSLTHDPTSMVLGRAAVFFNCMNKVERRLCAEAEMLEFLEKVYGPTETETLQELGLPENKYAAAGIAAAVLSNAESPEERFVDEFMWRLDDNLYIRMQSSGDSTTTSDMNAIKSLLLSINPSHDWLEHVYIPTGRAHLFKQIKTKLCPPHFFQTKKEKKKKKKNWAPPPFSKKKKKKKKKKKS